MKRIIPFLSIVFLYFTFGCTSETQDSKAANSQDKTTENASVEQENNDNMLYPWVDQLNIRDQASLKGKVIASIDRNEPLESTGVESDIGEIIVLRGVAYEDSWYQIRTKDGQEGWVFGGAVKRKGEEKGNPILTDTKFAFHHFGEIDLSSWRKMDTKIESEEVDYEITTYQKGDQILEITSSDMGEMYYGYTYILKDKDGKDLKERSFRFSGDGYVLEESVKDYTTQTEYLRTQSLSKHWYQLNAKPMMVNGNWTKRALE